MKVCEMCLKEKCDKGGVTVIGSVGNVDEQYSMCSECRKKLKKYIKFEQAKNKHK